MGRFGEGGTLHGHAMFTVAAAAIAFALLLLLLTPTGASDADPGERPEFVVDVVGGNERHPFGADAREFIYECSSDSPLFDEKKVVFDSPDSGCLTIGTHPMGLTSANFSYADDSVDVTFHVVDGTVTCLDAEQYYNTVNLWMFGNTDTVSISAAKLESASDESRGMKITNRVAHVVLSPDVVHHLHSLNSDVVFSMTSGAGRENVRSANLSDESTVISLRLSVDGTPLSHLGGKATVYVPHEVAYNENLSKVSAVYIDASGSRTDLEDVCYSHGDVVFCTDHFSEFAVIPEIEPRDLTSLAVVTVICVLLIGLVCVYLVRMRTKDKRVRVPVD
ncbi:MAG: hypothetical protein MJZ38_04395 [archaeon]|nr:hypothetical protein [archaeon]